MNYNYLSYDVGGTFVKYGVFDVNGNILKKDKFKTSIGNELIDSLVDHIQEITAEYGQLNGIGIGIPGLVKDNHIITAVNLELHDYPLKNELERRTSIPVTSANDASMATLGEKYYGSAQGYENYIMVTIGTGIGTGIILKNQLFEGAHGTFGELGHTISVVDGRNCECGNSGCLEMYSSLRGLLLNYNDLSGMDVTIDEFIKLDNSAYQIQAIDYASKVLGLSLANAITLLDLECVIIGGGLSEIKYLRDRVSYWTDHFLLPILRPAKVIKASLGNDAGIYGAYKFIHYREK